MNVSDSKRVGSCERGGAASLEHQVEDANAAGQVGQRREKLARSR